MPVAYGGIKHPALRGCGVFFESNPNTVLAPTNLCAWASFTNALTPTDDNGVVTVKLTIENKTNMIYLGMVAYDFSVYNEPVVVASASLKAPSALAPKGAIQAAEVMDERVAVRTENKNTTGLTVELHPKPQDFKTYYAGRVMINTLPSAPAYWTSAQTEDRKVKITARLKPGAAADGKTVYFRVVDPDPDDESPYEEDNIGGDNQATIDKPGHLSAPNAVAVVKPGAAFATAEVELTITDRHSGDNYRVECSLDPNFASVADATCTLVAWKRVGWRHHKMRS